MGKSDMEVMAQAHAADLLEPAGDPVWSALLAAPRPTRSAPLPEVVVGELLALADEGCTALVRYEGAHGGAAVRARSVVDLHASHVGRAVTLAFESGDAARPIVMGVLRSPMEGALAPSPGQLEVEADGARMVVSAREQLVMRCGKASITLTRTGKVLIEGSYVSSRSTGVNRIRGGSVQLN